MTETTKITIDTIGKLIEKTAEAEYQRGYATGLEEKRLTEKHWGRKTGKWVKDERTERLKGAYRYKCDNCEAYHRARYDFCPSCGADMREDKTE